MSVEFTTKLTVKCKTCENELYAIASDDNIIIADECTICKNNVYQHGYDDGVFAEQNKKDGE